MRVLIEDWKLGLIAVGSRSPYPGGPARRAARLDQVIALATLAKGTLKASRNFAREQFALMHRYALILLTNQPDSHVHPVVKVRSEKGKRRNRAQ